MTTNEALPFSVTGEAIRASTMATTVETVGDRIDVTTPSLAANIEIARLLESRGMGDVTVSFYTVLEGAFVWSPPGGQRAAGGEQ